MRDRANDSLPAMIDRGRMNSGPLYRRASSWIAALVLCVYLALACGTALTKRPWCDEACFANPGIDLITRGSFGYTAMDPTGYALLIGWVFPRVQTHAYFIMPFDPLLQAGWFKLFGVGVFTMRSLHIVFGLAALFCWGFLVLRLSGRPPAALLAVALIGVDRSFVFAAADGRPDMTSAAFGVAALAVYLGFRESRIGLAIFLANACMAASVLSHPIGGVSAFGLLYLAIHLDRSRLAWRHILIAAAPYVVGFGLWGWYISLDPEAFQKQFLANASTGRFGGLSAPLLGFWREVVIRYMERSYLPPYAGGWKKLMVLVPVLYGLAALICCFVPTARKSAAPAALAPAPENQAARIFGRLALLYFVVFSLLEGTKADFYLVHMTPLLCCCAAMGIDSWWIAGGVRRFTGAGVALLLVVFHIGWNVYSIRRDPYRQSYTAITTYIKRHAGPHALVMGGGELGFDLGFYGPVLEDATLGYYSGRQPDFVVVDDKCYRQTIYALEGKAPDVYRHVMKVLNQDCEKVFTSGTSDVYARRSLVRSN
jgi:hypothetical protein